MTRSANKAITKDQSSLSVDCIEGQTASDVPDVTDSVAVDDHEPGRSVTNVLYTADQSPSLHLLIFLGLQHCLTCSGGNFSITLIVAPAMCVTDLKTVSEILSTAFFVSGLVTLLQTTLGTRLPIVQGATPMFLVSALSILSLPKWTCPPSRLLTWNDTSVVDMTNFSHVTTSDLWKSRMLEIQGAIIVASLVEVVLGASGLIGLLLRYIGPLSIAPTITLVGLSLFRVASSFAARNWYIAFGTALLIILFSQYLRHVNIPCFYVTRRRQCARVMYPMFSLFPVILAVIVAWILCAILTVSGAIPDDPTHWSFHARTDVKVDVLHEANWFRFPYPFQWGIPTVSAGAVLGMIAGVLAGIVESIGDYYACARLAGAPPPPMHAVNRGIVVEGIGCVLAGMWGSGSGSTSYSENVGIIGITKVGSRRVVQLAGLYMTVLGVFGKFGALLVTIPDPVIGGVFLVTFGMISAVGISNLQYVDLNSPRNLCIFGFSVFFGLTLSTWIGEDDNSAAISTGTVEERGMLKWRRLLQASTEDATIESLCETAAPECVNLGAESGSPDIHVHHDDRSSKATRAACYDLPLGMSFFRSWKLFKFVPICPTFHTDVNAKNEPTSRDIVDIDRVIM